MSSAPGRAKRSATRWALAVVVLALVPVALWLGNEALSRRSRREAATAVLREVGQKAVAAYEREPTCTGPMPRDDDPCRDDSVPVQRRLRECAWCSLPIELWHQLCFSDEGTHGIDEHRAGWRCLRHSGVGPPGVKLEYESKTRPDGGGWFEARAVGDFSGFDDAEELLVLRGEVDVESRTVVMAPEVIERPR